MLTFQCKYLYRVYGHFYSDLGFMIFFLQTGFTTFEPYCLQERFESGSTLYISILALSVSDPRKYFCPVYTGGGQALSGKDHDQWQGILYSYRPGIPDILFHMQGLRSKSGGCYTGKPRPRPGEFKDRSGNKDT